MPRAGRRLFRSLRRSAVATDSVEVAQTGRGLGFDFLCFAFFGVVFAAVALPFRWQAVRTSF